MRVKRIKIRYFRGIVLFGVMTPGTCMVVPPYQQERCDKEEVVGRNIGSTAVDILHLCMYMYWLKAYP